MSKSESEDSYIALDEKPESIIKKFKRAVTDSDNKIKFSKDKAAISNLLAIYSSFVEKPIDELEKEYEGKGYGEFKKNLGELVAEKLSALQEKFNSIRYDHKRIESVISEGNKKANTIATEKLNLVKETIGFS
jgi:tryptophanyl-tRNA synthetase